MDVVVANELGAYEAIGNIGEAFLACLLQSELAPLRQAHTEGLDTFHEVLAACLEDVDRQRPVAIEEGLDRDLSTHIARACVVLADGTDHRLFRPLMAFARHRLGRHLLARTSLVRELIENESSFVATFERSLGRVASIAGRSPMELLVPLDEAEEGSQCAFCDRRWEGTMPQLQALPALIEKLAGDEAMTSTRESVMQFSGQFFQVTLDGDTPLENVCHHGHVIDKLVIEGCAVFDPWLGELAVGFVEPERDGPLLTGWNLY